LQSWLPGQPPFWPLAIGVQVLVAVLHVLHAPHWALVVHCTQRPLLEHAGKLAGQLGLTGQQTLGVLRGMHRPPPQSICCAVQLQLPLTQI
jgi:hypothetical protein